MGTSLTSTQLGDLRQLFSTPVESGGDGNSYNPNVVNYNGTSWKQDGQGGYVSLGDLFGDNEYNFQNFGNDGTFNAEGVGRMSDWDPLKEFAMVMAAMAGGVGLAGAAGMGGVNPVLSGLSNTGAITSGTAGLTGATTGLSGITSGAAGGGGPNFSGGFTDGGTAGGALDTSYAAGSAGGTGGSIVPQGGQSSGLDFSTGYTDNGTAGGALDTSYASGSAGGTGGSISPSTVLNGATTATKALTGGEKGNGFGLDDILKLAGGITDKNAQEGASEQLLNYLKERQAINDNMYKPGSPEYNALWDEMSRKDAAAGRNSQYGPRSVDLAARVAGLKMDANTKMTTGIGNLYKAGLDQDAGSNAGLLSMLGDLSQGGDFDWLNDFDLEDIPDWIGDLFD